MTAGDADALAKELTAMVDDVWKQQGMPKTINKKVTQAFAKQLWQGVVKGYTKDLIGISYDSPDYEMLKNLQNNVYHFSAAKNYQQLKALTNALIGDDGKLCSYSQFKKAAYEINDTHVNQWLKVEYDTAVASGQMASKWVDIQRTKGTLGMLEFDAVMDSRTSAICSSLNGVLKPVDDAFWKMYYPPNHFGCRSTIRQRSGGIVTPDDRIDYPEKVPEMFKTNLAANGLVFPKGHPYYNHVPEDALISFGDANYKLDSSREFSGKAGSVYESGIAYDPTKQFDQRYYTEYNMRLNAADSLASHYKTDVFICPDFTAPHDDWRYPYFYKGIEPYKQPDLLFNKTHWELKGYEGNFSYDKISKMIRRAMKQSDNIILKIEHDINIANVKERAIGFINKSTKAKGIKKILLIDAKGQVHELK